MKYIRHIFKKIGYRISGFLRRICGGLSPAGRLVTILTLLTVFFIGNLYFTITAIYNWGKSDREKEIPEIRHIDGLDIDTIKRIEWFDSPVDIQIEETDSINNKFLIDNEKGTRNNRSC